jgi:hypothetical protein
MLSRKRQAEDFRTRRLPALIVPIMRAGTRTHGWPSISVPFLRRGSSGDQEVATVILRDLFGKFLGCPILERPVRATLVILSPPGLNSFLGFVQGLEPVGIQALAV